MKNYFFLIFILACSFTFAQQDKNPDVFDYEVRSDVGDLNRDGLRDKVVILMASKSESEPLKLEISLLQKNKKYNKIYSSSTLLNVQYPGGKYGGDQIPSVFIEDGLLKLLIDIGDNKKRYTFKYENGKFNLIQFENILLEKNGVTIYTDFDLKTGSFTKTKQSYEDDIVLVKKKIALKPLPTIEDFCLKENKWNF